VRNLKTVLRFGKHSKITVFPKRNVVSKFKFSLRFKVKS